jgi:aconitate hydratase
MANSNSFGARASLKISGGEVVFYRLSQLEESGVAQISKLPYSIKVLLEAALRQHDGFEISDDDVKHIAGWNAKNPGQQEIPYKPARVVLQDFTGVPCVVDLAAMRAAVTRLGGDAARINPIVPVDLVIDHSVQVDQFGSAYALMYNAEREFERNLERYQFLRWGQKAFDNFCVVPPATGIVHQVNLEYLAKVVQTRSLDGVQMAYPDTLVGTDSHTTMINGLGVLGWGVGGIEAEAVMLGQPMYFLMPEVIGVKLTGALPEGATATDLVLTVTQMLRKRGVVEKFVEFYGTGLSKLSLADRATIANMAPEYGATCGFFPVDDETLRYLRNTGREADLVERYCKEQGLFRTDASPDPVFTDSLELDLSTIEPSLAGPKRPQDRIALKDAKQSFQKALVEGYGKQPAGNGHVKLTVDGTDTELADGSVIIAAITSCTNTSNPSVMIGAGLVARKAVELGLTVPPYVKTSLAPGSKVVTRYLAEAGLDTYLDQLRFNVVGYGCTTCIGNSGPVDEAIAKTVKDHNLVVAAVLSGNRNFEGRVHAVTRANYLASPPLVVAYALAGRMDIDFETDPIGTGKDGQPVYLRDIWPTQSEVRETLAKALKPEMFTQEYSNVFEGSPEWQQISIAEGSLYQWNAASTYIQEPPFFIDLSKDTPPMRDISGARALAVLGDSITTDHISPAGSIAADSPAARYLIANKVQPIDFNSYGSRRGNHEVMMRGTFANIRLKNKLVGGVEGALTRHLPSGEQMAIYDAAMRYQQEATPLIILAGKEYGSGSSRDWAAKGTILLGVRAVIAQSYERIHRSNLVGMGVLPLQFKEGQDAESVGLDGTEVFSIEGLASLQPHQTVTVRARKADGSDITFSVLARIDSPVELKYWQNGGILHSVLRDMIRNG